LRAQPLNLYAAFDNRTVVGGNIAKRLQRGASVAEAMNVRLRCREFSAARAPGAIPGKVRTGFPSGIAQKQKDRAVLRFR